MLRAYLWAKTGFPVCYSATEAALKDKLLSLTQMVAIDVCAYAVMSNHTHTVVFADISRVKSGQEPKYLNVGINCLKGLY